MADYRIGEVAYEDPGINGAVSIAAGLGVAYATKDWSWFKSYAMGFGADAVVKMLLDTVNPPTNVKVIITVGEVKNREFYESIITSEYYYQDENGNWLFVKSITQYNGRFEESILY